MGRRNTGTIERIGEGRYRLRWFVGRDAAGKRVYRSQTVRGTKRDAEKAMRDAIAQRERGAAVDAHYGETVDAYLDRWLESTRSIREQTRADYRRALRLYVRPAIGGRRLDRLAPLDVQAMVRSLETRKRPLSPRTIRLAVVVLSAALKQAVQWRMILANPCTGVALPQSIRREMKAMNRGEADRFRAALDGRTHAEFFSLLLATGLRPSEALALFWRDLELEGERSALAVRRTLPRQAKGAAPRFEAPKTAASRRVVPLPPSLAVLLRGLRASQGVSALDGSDLVFRDADGAPLDALNLSRRHFKPACDRAGLEGFRLYDLRHSFATISLEAGVHPKVVAERLGHSSTRLTLDVYAHVTAPMADDATAKIEAALFGP